MADSPDKMLVINEWLFQDIKGENGQTKRQETGRFLAQFALGQDRFAATNGSPWMAKAYELMRHSDPAIRLLSRQLHELLRNSNKCKRLQPDDVADAAPQDAIDTAPDEDVYLIQTYYAADADLLITTDEGLHNAFVSRQDVEVMFRNPFLEDYLNS